MSEQSKAYVEHRVDVHVPRAIMATWPYQTDVIGAAWLMVLQFHQNGRPFEYFDQKRHRASILAMGTAKWNRDRARIRACYDALLAATTLKVEYGRQPISAQDRAFVYARDKGACVYCGVSVSQGEFHCDHVVPVSQGGHSRSDNLACACAKCNLSKSAKTPEQWRGVA